MKEPTPDTTPTRGESHAALDLFAGRWRAEGWSYTGRDPSARNPKEPRERWLSTIEARWHTGGHFLIQDERQYSGEATSGVFDTHSVFGVDPATNECFVHTFENHGFFRLYRLKRDGRSWVFEGKTERASVEFSEDARRQVIAWELLTGGAWKPLCDRVAFKD